MADQQLRMAFVMDPVESESFAASTSLILMLEAQQRGHKVLYIAPEDLAVEAGRAGAAEAARGERAEQAREQLGAYCDELDIPRSQLRVVVGAVTGEILRLQKELVADLIVIGHHPRSGLSALFSHTDDGVLTRACCDVLALNLDC